MAKSDNVYTGQGGIEDPRPLDPLIVLGDRINNDDDVLNWATNARDISVKLSRDRIREIRRNIALYSGKHHEVVDSHETRARSQSTAVSRTLSSAAPQTAKVTVNHLFDLTEHRVARYMRFRPTVSVLPANSDEESDRQSSALVKELVDYLQYSNDFEAIIRQNSRRRTIAGESYVYIGWDENKGDFHPDAKKAKKKGKKPKIMEGDEERELSDSESRIGDVCYRVPQTYNIFLQPVPDGDFDKVEWILEKSKVNIDILKKDYPEKANEIEKTGEKRVDDADEYLASLTGEWDMEDKVILENYIPVWELWHKATPHLPNGRHIVFTDNVVLVNQDHPYDHKKLPYIRITDIDVDGQLYAISIYQQTKQLNSMLNNMYSMIHENQVTVGSPKWTVPRSARVSKQNLGNAITILEYDGQIPPKLQVFNNTPTEVFAFAQDLKETEQQLFGVGGVSRGEPPPGIKAGVALSFLNEQEDQRFNSDIMKHNKAIREIWMMTLEVVTQFYNGDDDRLIRIFGKNKEYQVKKFDPTILNTRFDIRVQNQSSLPDSKAARTQYLLDIDERKPMPDDVFYEYLDLGIPEAYTNEVTQAKKAADIEDADILDGNPVEEPAEWEDHLAHWQRHFTFMQSRGFKMLEEQRRTALVDHLRVHEMFLMEKAFLDGNITIPLNPSLVELLSQMPAFPAVYKPNVDIITQPEEPLPPEMPPEEMLGAPPGPGGAPLPPDLATLPPPLTEGAPIEEPIPMDEGIPPTLEPPLP